MAEIGTRAPRFSLRDITSYQWLVLFVAWAGWSLDITDFTGDVPVIVEICSAGIAG